ncbi:RNI-like superfamily protein [Rhynchospora pubera]|uniref:RNI-like superfamily protein n=1 Tax=Rhynchospora pubera TaxID=906938 RepID=A0AAV8CDV9_9POAL|nr:RNI-like superfamily protein [Rhynchospora pubera]
MKRRKKKSSRGRDWSALQPEVLVVIFRKIGALEVLRTAGSVCRSWRKVATEEPQLWRRIDMTNHGYGSDALVLMDPTRCAIDRSNGQLEEFSIEYFGDDNLLQYLCDRTSVLKRLCLISCWQLYGEAIIETARRQPLLEELQITFGSFSENMTEIVGRECPQLKSFKFNNTWYNLPPFGPDDNEYLVDDEGAFGIANTMHQLRHLQLIGNRMNSHFSFGSQTLFRMTNKGLKAILDGCPHLETLDIRRCRNVKMDADMRAYCAKLKTMRLSEDSLDGYQFQADTDGQLDYINFCLSGAAFYRDGCQEA